MQPFCAAPAVALLLKTVTNPTIELFDNNTISIIVVRPSGNAALYWIGEMLWKIFEQKHFGSARQRSKILLIVWAKIQTIRKICNVGLYAERRWEDDTELFKKNLEKWKPPPLMHFSNNPIMWPSSRALCDYPWDYLYLYSIRSHPKPRHGTVQVQCRHSLNFTIDEFFFLSFGGWPRDNQLEYIITPSSRGSLPVLSL